MLKSECNSGARFEVGLVQLTKKKTLSELDVEALKALGCEIERVGKE